MEGRSYGRYVIRDRIGRGGMAAIFLAHDPMFGREVALKVLPPEFLHDPSFRGRFEREARVIATLEHPAIVPVYDFGEDHGQPYLVMRLMRGGSLADKLQRGPLPLPEAGHILDRIGGALDHAHFKGIIHRDLKPANILFDELDEPFLADFGIVKIAEATSTLTSGGIVGTPAYMSPEQVHGDKQIDGRSDIYALGVILFEMLTGKGPFHADTPAKLMMAHVLNPTPQITLVRPDLPPQTNAIISRAMAKDRSQRYSSGKEMAHDFTGTFMTPSMVATRSGDATIVEPFPTDASATVVEPLPPTSGYQGANSARSATPPPGTAPHTAPPAQSPARSGRFSGSRAILPIVGILGLLLCCGAAAIGLWQLGYLDQLGIGREGATETRAQVVSDATSEVSDGTAEVGSDAPTATAAIAGGETPEAPAGGPVTDLQEVSSAVVQILARGTFVDPEFGLQQNTAGAGSGFIIDPSGLAVTNNHVVAGASTLEVYLDGESGPRNARILGVSECSDLAVIDIDGDGFPYLAWREEPITVGLDVYAAGFPLGEPQFALTRGIVSKDNAAGETSWASVDFVLQHDATINPGNSGGPLIDPQARVVGVNYAGASGVDQYFAIARNEALPTIEVLRGGEDVDSIGISGEAVSNGADLTGIWVSAVESGSPADVARIEPGDIILAIEDFVLATDGTMADYCDILRTRGSSATLTVDVLRYPTGATMSGQLSGSELETERAIGIVDFLATELPEGGTDYTYWSISDDSGRLQVEAPTSWSDTNGGAWTRDDVEVGAAVSAAPNRDDFFGTWDTPGLFFGASDSLGETPTSELDFYDYSESCDFGGRFEYRDEQYAGHYDLWVNCGSNGSVYLLLAVEPPDGRYLVLLTVQATNEGDLPALDRILAGFTVNW